MLWQISAQLKERLFVCSQATSMDFGGMWLLVWTQAEECEEFPTALSVK